MMLLLAALYSAVLTNRFTRIVGISLHVAYFASVWVVSPLVGQLVSVPCLLAWGLAGAAILMQLFVLDSELDAETKTPAVSVTRSFTRHVRGPATSWCIRTRNRSHRIHSE